MIRQQWGELPVLPDTNSGIAAIEREQVTKPTPLEVTGSPIHSIQKPGIVATVNDRCPDDIVLNTIELLQYNRKVRSLIAYSQVQTQVSDKKGDKRSSTALPTMPEIPNIIKHKKPGYIKGKKRNSAFALGIRKPVPVPPHNIVWQILKKAVGVIACHAGYESSTDQILATLTEVTQEFFIRACAVLRKNADKEMATGDSVFVDVIEKTFHDIGIGSVTKLHHFYQDRIVKYHKRVLAHCKFVTMEYNRMKIEESCQLKELKMANDKESSYSKASHSENSPSSSSSEVSRRKSSNETNSSLKKDKLKNLSSGQKIAKKYSSVHNIKQEIKSKLSGDGPSSGLTSSRKHNDSHSSNNKPPLKKKKRT